jgi:hypothetical protein
MLAEENCNDMYKSPKCPLLNKHLLCKYDIFLYCTLKQLKRLKYLEQQLSSLRSQIPISHMNEFEMEAQLNTWTEI